MQNIFRKVRDIKQFDITTEQKRKFNQHIQIIEEEQNEDKINLQYRVGKDIYKFILYVFNAHYKAQVNDNTLNKIFKDFIKNQKEFQIYRTLFEKDLKKQNEKINKYQALLYTEIKKQIIKKHLIKNIDSFENFGLLGIDHRRPITIQNKKGNPESNKSRQQWFSKNPKNKKEVYREILASELMRIFIPETPKYRILKTPSREDKIISQKVGFSQGSYKPIIEQLVKLTHEERDNHFKTDYAFAKQIYKILLANLIIGNYDSSAHNIIYTQDVDGKRTLYPIDFGCSFFNMKQLLKKDAKKTADQKCDRTFNSIISKKQLNKAAFKEASYEISKTFYNESSNIKRTLSLMCYTLEMHSALDINDEGMINLIESNFEYAKEIKFLMTEEEIEEYEKNQPRYRNIVRRETDTSYFHSI